MDYEYLNKKWTTYFNWTFFYPTMFLLIMFSLLIFGVFTAVTATGNSYFDLTNFGYLLGLVSISVIAFVIFFVSIFFISLIYLIWFVLATDKLYKILNFNRLLWNILTIISIVTGLFFIIPIILWFKIKEKYDENHLNYKFSGILKK